MHRSFLSWLVLAVAVSLVCVGLTSPTSDLSTHSRWEELDSVYHLQQQRNADFSAYVQANLILQDLRYEAVLDLASREAVRAASVRRRAESSAGTGRWAIPASIVMCESGGDYRAENPSSSASGAYQITDGTWDGYGGYSHASDAPPSVQDERARQLYDGGRGRSHWVC